MGKGFYFVWENTSLFLAFVSFILILSVCNVCMEVITGVPWWARAARKTTFWSQFSPATFA